MLAVTLLGTLPNTFKNIFTMTKLLLLVSLTIISSFYSCKKSTTDTDPFKDLDPNTKYCFECLNTPKDAVWNGCYTYSFFLSIQWTDNTGNVIPYDVKKNCKLI